MTSMDNHEPSDKASVLFPKMPTVWACRLCGKADWSDTDEQLAKPEHVSYRGVNIGTCKGKMVPLYSVLDIQRANQAT